MYVVIKVPPFGPVRAVSARDRKEAERIFTDWLPVKNPVRIAPNVKDGYFELKDGTRIQICEFS